MYEGFYGFRKKPFAQRPDPAFLYFSEKHQLAIEMLKYGIENEFSFSVLTGDIGTGKTALIRHLLTQFDENFTVGLVSNMHPSFGELLRWILWAFELDGYKSGDKVEMHQQLFDFLISQYSDKKRTVLVIDEAQHLDAATVEELRLLTNINADHYQLLQVILVGQNGLRDTLQDPFLQAVAQRIAVDPHLVPLDRIETRNYIHHRLSVAGGDPEIFSTKACAAVFDYSDGIPRVINLVSEWLLFYSYTMRSKKISAAIARQVFDKINKKGSDSPLALI